MGSPNAEWHRKNKIPNKPTFSQRMRWHAAHAKICACRPVPVSLLRAGKKE